MRIVDRSGLAGVGQLGHSLTPEPTDSAVDRVRPTCSGIDSLKTWVRCERAATGSTRDVSAPHGAREVIADPLRAGPATALAYESLLASLELQHRAPRPRHLLVTSAQPGEGKSTVAAGLARTMAGSGRRVLLVDGDLRRPAQHRIFEVSNERGLADLLAGRAEPKDVTHAIRAAGASDASTLELIPSGRVQGSVLSALSNGSLAALIGSLAEHRDFLVLDSPPLLSVEDASFYSPHVDGVLIVASTGDAKVQEVVRVRERVEAVGGRVLGVVLNRFDERMHGASHQPYHAYYQDESS